MNEITLGRGIACDVTFHNGSWYVASHIGSNVMVEQLSDDLSTRATFATIPVGQGGNAAPRICSWDGVLWLAYRDGKDRGHLVRLDTGEDTDLGPVFGQRPFAFGIGRLAAQTGPTTAPVRELDDPATILWTDTFSSAPTGLSLIDDDGVVTWEQIRTRHPWGAGWTIDGPAEFAEGVTFTDADGVTKGLDSGLVGHLTGTPGYYVLWPGLQVRDPRISVNGGDIAVVGWGSNGPIRLAIVTAADLVPALPGQSPPPPPPVIVVPLPKPDALPNRPPFLVGCCWPMPYIDPMKDDIPSPEGMAAIKAHGITGLRVDCDYRRPDLETLLVTIAEAGLIPLPLVTVWGLHQPRPADLTRAIAEAAMVFLNLAVRLPWILEWEVVNEPKSRMTPAECASIVSIVGAAIKAGNPMATVWMPGSFREMLDPIGGPPFLGIGATTYFRDMTRLIPATSYDGVSVHPYRNPRPPEFSGFGTRQKEHAEVRKQVGTLPIICTEVGWWPEGALTYQDIGDYISRELAIEQSLGISGCYLYAHQGPWGLFADDWTPRPAALAIQAFLGPPEPPPEPTPEPPPVDPAIPDRAVTVRTMWDHPVVATAGGGDLLFSGSDAFTLIWKGGKTFAVQTPTGHFWRAEGGGGSTLTATTTLEMGASIWETFTLEVHGDGYAFRCSDDKHYVSADLSYGGRLVADRTEVGEWEIFRLSIDPFAAPVQPPVPVIEPVLSLLRIVNAQLVNDAGVFRPLFMSGFTLASDMVRFPDKAQRFLDYAKAEGFNGVRVFGGELSWAGQTNADVLRGLPSLLTAARARGLYVELSILTETGRGYDAEAHVRAVLQVAQQFTNVLPEIANEPYHTTHSSQVHDLAFLDRLGQTYAAPFPYAVGAPTFDEAAPDGSLPSSLPGEWVSIHLNRSRDEWNMVRRIRELETIQKASRRWVMNNEPIGWAETSIAGKRSANPHVAFAMGLLSRCFDVGVVSHSESGLRADLPGPVQHACHQMLVRGFRCVVRGFRCVPFTERLTYKNSGWSETSAPIKSFNVSAAVRCYSFVTGTRGVTAIIGKTGDPAIQWQHGWHPVRTVDDVGAVEVLEIQQGG